MTTNLPVTSRLERTFLLLVGLLLLSGTAWSENNFDSFETSSDHDLLPLGPDTAPPIQPRWNPRDLDGDGLDNFWELFVFGTNPDLADSDFDGLDDDLEVLDGTDPNDANSPLPLRPPPPPPSLFRTARPSLLSIPNRPDHFDLFQFLQPLILD